MTQYIVLQRPRAKYRAGLSTSVMIVEAKTAAEAIRTAVEKGKVGSEDWFGPSREYCAPEASQVVPNKLMMI